MEPTTEAAADFHLAIAHWRLGDQEQARQCFGDALELTQGDVENQQISRLRNEAAELLNEDAVE